MSHFDVLMHATCDMVALDIYDDDALKCPEDITDFSTVVIRSGVGRLDLPASVPTQLRQQTSLFDFKRQIAIAEAARICVVNGTVFIAESLGVNPLVSGCRLNIDDEALVCPNEAIRNLVFTASGGPAVLSVTLLGKGT